MFLTYHTGRTRIFHSENWSKCSSHNSPLTKLLHSLILYILIGMVWTPVHLVEIILTAHPPVLCPQPLCKQAHLYSGIDGKTAGPVGFILIRADCYYQYPLHYQPYIICRPFVSYVCAATVPYSVNMQYSITWVSTTSWWFYLYFRILRCKQPLTQFTYMSHQHLNPILELWPPAWFMALALISPAQLGKHLKAISAAGHSF